MIYDVLILIVLFLLSFFWAPPKPMQLVVWVLLAIALLVLILPFAGLRLMH
jgi:hypothetical protein